MDVTKVAVRRHYHCTNSYKKNVSIPADQNITCRNMNVGFLRYRYLARILKRSKVGIDFVPVSLISSYLRRQVRKK